MRLINILIINGHDSGGFNLRETIISVNDFNLLGELTYDHQTVHNASFLKPDVVVINNNVPGKNTIEITEKIKQMLPEVNVLALTIDTDQHRFYKIIKAGALGYILKDSDPATLCEAIRTVANGDAYIQPCLLSKLLTEFRQLTNEQQLVSPEQLGLTQRELEIVTHIARGKSNKDIAEKLYISEKTVKNHVSNILKKMSLEDRTQVAVYAYQKGLIVSQR